MKKGLLSLLAVVGTGLPALAQLPAEVAATNAPALAPTNAAGGVDVLRDPFWPVATEPAPPEPERTEEEQAVVEATRAIERQIQWPALKLKGMTRAGKERYLAIIDGIGMVESGQAVSVRHGDVVYSWLIETVDEKGVMYRRLEAEPYLPPGTAIPRTQ